MEKGLLKTKEAARYLSISTRTLRELRKKGAIKAVRLGSQYRFRPETLDAVAADYEKTGRDLND
jgi:excisionase family DNA binding protein